MPGVVLMPIGVFGKYPGRRDFISVGMPQAILSPLEKWLQAGLATSKEAFGMRWKEMFLVQPIWNFRLGREIGGVDCLGAFMPSVDGVGRYFPLLLLAYPPDKSFGYPLWMDLDIGGWFDTVHAALLATLSDGNLPDPADIAKSVAEPPSVAIAEGDGKPGSRGLRVEMGEQDREDFRDALQRHDLAFAGNRQSVWWTDGGAHVARQVLVVPGMPEPHVFSGMLGPTVITREAQAGA
jgi:type VI secretion system protein ImpM